MAQLGAANEPLPGWAAEVSSAGAQGFLVLPKLLSATSHRQISALSQKYELLQCILLGNNFLNRANCVIWFLPKCSCGTQALPEKFPC